MLAEAAADEGQEGLDVRHEWDRRRYCWNFIRFLMCASDLEGSLDGSCWPQQEAECRLKS